MTGTDDAEAVSGTRAGAVTGGALPLGSWRGGGEVPVSTGGEATVPAAARALFGKETVDPVQTRGHTTSFIESRIV